MKKTFILPLGWNAMSSWLEEHITDKNKLRVTIEPYRKKRSLDQNSFLHGVPLRLIAEHTGHEVEDLKTYLLGECFGWVEVEVFGAQRRKPLYRSSELDTVQFGTFLDYIEQWAAQELDMIIPRPNENLHE